MENESLVAVIKRLIGCLLLICGVIVVDRVNALGCIHLGAGRCLTLFTYC